MLKIDHMLKIDIDDRTVLAALDTLQRRVSNMAPVMHDIGQALMEGSRRRIAQGRDWTGAPFAPNSPATLAKKRGSRPLINRGNFMDRRLFYQARSAPRERGSTCCGCPRTGPTAVCPA